MKYGHSKCQGVTSIEFALGSLVLIITTLMIFEMGFRIYVTNMVEYALRETVRNTTVFEGQSSYDQYNQTLNTAMEEPDRLWGFLTPAENFQLSGKYYLTYADLISDVSSMTTKWHKVYRVRCCRNYAHVQLHAGFKPVWFRPNGNHTKYHVEFRA